MYFWNPVFLSLLFSLQAVMLVAQQGDTHRAGMAKNLDIYHSVIKELDLFYVDSIRPDQLIPEGIEMMLSKLDPYTNVFISEKDLDDFMFMVTGEYGGIGSGIVSRNGKTCVSEPYEGLPADLAGLKAGDEILAIDDIRIEDIEKPTEMLKGLPNTKVKVKYLRPGASKPATVEILRKRIQLNPVTYYGVLGDSVGYIYLSGFTDQCAREVRQAFEDLKENRGISSLILDLRDNSGGSMEEAIRIINLFVPKGKVVLSTRGKLKQWDRTYRTALDAADEEIPLVVMVNESSASAAEIVSGTVQDLDRGVLVGRRTYGKGLVQTTRELPYNTSLKVTTSRYYIPSGRCIQAVDYAHRAPDGSAGAIPDSLTSLFNTEKGRPVRDGGGVMPDVTVEEKRQSNIIYYLLADYIIFDYVTQWVQSHPEIAPVEDFVFPGEDYESFKFFVKGKNFMYDRQSEKALENLREIMEFEGYLGGASEELKALETRLHPDLDRDLEISRDFIVRHISREIVKRYYYQKGEIVQALKSDDDLKKALEILGDRALYQKILSAPEQ